MKREMSRSIWMCVVALTLAAVGCTESTGVGIVSVTCPDGTQERDGECVLPVRVAVGPSSVGPAREGRAFVVQFEAAGGEAPYTYSVEGDLPSGLSLAQTGALSGTPAEGSAGQYELRVAASDVEGNLGEVSLSLRVEEAILDPECEPSDEVCDGLDNDCDGVVDNAPGDVGEACGPTEGVCQRGSSACVDGEIVCEGVVERGEEVCDGADNDCDGQIDEDVLNACGECGDVPEEVCDGEDNDCDGQTDEDVLNACGECGDVPQEVCDGEDNNCDGQTDEGVLNACGECGDVPVEVCDGVDNDCDGQADEGCPCETGQREACGLSEGVCEPGERECVGGVWGECEGGQGPSPEACDGVDNDCDGQTDEDVLNACGECGPVPQEVCDGEDNDCDGQTDEGVLNACGECGPVPQEVCDGEDNDCDGQTDEGVLNACGECGPVPQEVCDGEDNDCDGQVDEGLEELGACDVDEAPCGGQRACVGGEVVCEAVAPSDEVCDGEDNDCDGQIDEDDGGQPLSRECGQDGCDSRGVQVCAGGSFGACEFPQEVCDGEDNDCDGQIDDAVPGVGERCGEGDDLCEQGLTACVGGELICDGLGQGVPEVCDGEDNDCDGQIDEGVLNACGECGPVPQEVCDGDDNDCDGQVDEDIAEVGQPCAVDRCGEGEVVCDGARGLICDVEPVNAGTVQRVPVEGGFARSYTGTEAPFISNQGQSYSVLLASDGERIYNVSFGIDGTPFAGWTVRIFVPTADGLALQEELTIAASWPQEDVEPFGFAGVAAKDGVLTVLNVASSNFPGSVWTVDTQAETAEVAYLWEDRDTFEAPAEYDWNRDLFWTIQLNAEAPVVFAYEGSGIDPDVELERFQVFSQVGPLGNIASDGANLYGLAYSNQQQPGEVVLARFGSGFGGTSPGGDFQRLAQVRASASLTFHRDGYLYTPDQNNVGQVVRVAATVGPIDEVCDGLDNDCDGSVDEEVCEGSNLAVGSAGAVQVDGGQRAVRLEYSVGNRGGATASAHTDVVFLASPEEPTVNLATLGTFERGPLEVAEVRRYQEVMTLPDDLVEGDWLVVVVVDQALDSDDVDRSNNTARVEFFFEEPEACEVDEFDSGVRNDTFDDAAPVGRFDRFDDLTLCPGDDEDWFVVEVPRFRGQTFLLESERGVSLDIVIFNDDGDIVEEGSTENTGSALLRVMTGNQRADFFALVKNADPDQGPTTYRLTLGGI